MAGDTRVHEGVRRAAAEALGRLGQVEAATTAWRVVARDTSVGGAPHGEAAEALERLERVDRPRNHG